ncbi:methylated-DNA-[protein]-cysteine S-methyltransferase [Luteibacter sp. Sphag1AF]|uniref:methylated-DNA--[protein]-cysteine S-methyltransferase n=1 Tax=Luteibacter sp. Sphag1AF TaxID=2587031 RepID=UPI001608618B|nr:methylated-DNA--[protein]-cysteine S-methyltransferase [Luteibacter sp. Sphag1AF]MBB3225474.1 methylated-DNA-[protein]-cysteine S-methyltransferase [Luteibacter sp. Sphag1AF]
MTRRHVEHTIASPVGRLRLLATEEGLTAIEFADFHERRRWSPAPPTMALEETGTPEERDAADILHNAVAQLKNHFAGKRERFDLPLCAEGTPFQQAVWRGLQDIPFGVTESYGQLARRIGHPQAIRAVGAANGANPLSIVVPCHRVIGANGTLTGFGGGLPAKRYLLALERASSEPSLFSAPPTRP